MDYEEAGFVQGDLTQKERRYLLSGKDFAEISDLFPKNPKLMIRFFDFKKRVYRHKKKGLRKDRIVRQIFARAMYLIMEKVVNGDTFVTPKKDEVYVRAIPDDVVKNLRQAGHFSDIDIVKTGFTLPEVVYVMKNKKPKRISLYKPLRDKLIENIENKTVVLHRIFKDLIW